MRTGKIDRDGSILTYNENGKLHSFNGKPSLITREGKMVFHKDGVALKTVFPDGGVIVWKFE